MSKTEEIGGCNREEEKNAEDLIRKFELFGSDPKGLYALNQELLAREHTAPSVDD